MATLPVASMAGKHGKSAAVTVLFSALLAWMKPIGSVLEHQSALDSCQHPRKNFIPVRHAGLSTATIKEKPGSPPKAVRGKDTFEEWRMPRVALFWRLAIMAPFSAAVTTVSA